MSVCPVLLSALKGRLQNNNKRNGLSSSFAGSLTIDKHRSNTYLVTDLRLLEKLHLTALWQIDERLVHVANFAVSREEEAAGKGRAFEQKEEKGKPRGKLY